MTVPSAELRPREAEAPGSPYYSMVPDRVSVQDFDYIEEEWVARGVEDGNTYETVLLVRRPRDPAAFSGTLLLESLHIHGVLPIWMYCQDYLLRSGHAWAYVVSQKLALEEHLRPSSPERFKDTHIAGPSSMPVGGGQPAEGGAQALAMWADVKRYLRGSNAILAQVAVALRGSAGPFAEMPVARIVLGGHSETGLVTSTFMSEAHHKMRRSDGLPVFDGYFLTGFALEKVEGFEVPVVHVMSEGDLVDGWGLIPGFTYRRDDSDDKKDLYRLYELAAMPHMGTREEPFNSVELWRMQVPEQYPVPPGGDRMSSLPHNELFSATLHHLLTWVADGTPPPKADRLQLEQDKIVTDEFGHTVGGVRCAQVDVPHAYYTPTGCDSEGNRYFLSVGGERAFEPETLTRVYGERQAFIAEFDRRVGELVREGWLLEAHADGMRAEARQVSFA